MHLFTSEGCASQGLSGRLADPVLLSRSLSQAYPGGTGVVHENGFPSQRRQIGSLPSPAIHLSGHCFRHGSVAGPSSESPGHPAQSLHLPASPPPQCPSQSLGYTAGSHGIASSPHSSGPSSQVYASEGLSGEVVPVSPALGCPHSPRSLVSSGNSSLVGPILGLSGGAYLSCSPSGGALHGCIQQGLGRTHGPPVSSGSLVRSSVLRSHQPARAGGVFLALQQFLPSAQGRHILLNTDNTTVACYINRQGGARSPTLSKWAEHLLLWCSQHSIVLTAKHIPGKLNVLADSLSRSNLILHTEWTLDSAVLAPVWEAWFRPLVDLFATRFNHKLPTFVSPVPDPAAWAVDALSIPWAGLLAASHSVEGSQEGQRRASHTHPHCSEVAGSALVPRAAVSLPCTSSQAPPSSQGPSPAQVGNRSRESRPSRPSRLATVRHSLS